MLNLYLETMTQIALNYGATIDKYIGDGIMLFFGDPESAGIKEDAVNCVKMAQEMQETLHGLQDNWHQYGLQSPLQMRIGIATGFCTVGNFGSETRLEYTAIGSGVNTASRLEAAAENGEILMSFDTYSLVSDQIPCQELATVHLKGIGPVRTFQPLQNIEDIQSSISLEVGSSSLNANLSALSVEDLDEFEASLLRAIEKVKGTKENMSQQESLL